MAFMSALSDMIKNGDDTEIYAEVASQIAKSTPGAFSSYLAKVTPERQRVLEGLAESHLP